MTTTVSKRLKVIWRTNNYLPCNTRSLHAHLMQGLRYLLSSLRSSQYIYTGARCARRYPFKDCVQLLTGTSVFWPVEFTRQHNCQVFTAQQQMIAFLS